MKAPHYFARRLQPFVNLFLTRGQNSRKAVICRGIFLPILNFGGIK
jgi:hypothetical protein